MNCPRKEQCAWSAGHENGWQIHTFEELDNKFEPLLDMQKLRGLSRATPREKCDNRATFHDAGAQLEGVWRRQLQSLPFLWEILCAQLANSVLPSLLLSLATEINHARDDLTGPAEIIEKYNFSRFCSNSSKGSSGGVRKGQIHQVKWTQQRCFVTVCWCL